MAQARPAPAEPLNAPRAGWDQMRRQWQWRQGEHVILAGPTECGKTTLGLWLCEQRKYVVVLGMKPKDDVLDDLIRRGWQRTAAWPPPPADRHGNRRIVLWPVTRKAENRDKARKVFRA